MTTFQLSNTHSINYLFHISFTLQNDNNILWEIYSTYTLSVRKRVIHTKKVYICFTKVYEYRIAYFPFHSVFLSVPFSVPRFSNTRKNTYTCVLAQSEVQSHIQYFSVSQRYSLLKAIAHGNKELIALQLDYKLS